MIKNFKNHKAVYVMRLIFLLFLSSLIIFVQRNMSAQETSLQNDSGISLNQNVRSLVLIDEAISALDRGDSSKASELFIEAQELTPNLPQIYFYLARLHFTISSGGFLASLPYVNKMFETIFRNFWWSFYFFSFIIVSLSLTLYISAVGFIGIMVYSKLPLFIHDIKEEWNNLLLLVPSFVVMFVGPLFSMVALLLPFWIYLDKKQRIMSFISIALIGILLMLLPTLSVFSTLPNNQSFKDIVTIAEGESTGFEFQSLKNDSRWQSLFSMAIALKRKGNCEEAVVIYKKLIQEKKDPRLYNNLGNCYVAEGMHKSAMAYYKKAFGIKSSATLLFNMSQLLREELKFKEAELSYEKARQLDPFLTPFSKEHHAQHKGMFVIDQNLKWTELWDLAFSLASDYSQTPYIRKSLSSLSIPLSLFLLLAITAAFLIINAYRSTGTYQCRRCGSTYCPSCEKKVFSHSQQLGEHVCVLCFKTLVRLDELEPKRRVERLLSIQRYKNSRKKKFKLLEFLIPGIGHLYYEKPLYGMPVFFFYSFFLSLFLFTLVITPFPLTNLTSSLFRWTGIICLSVIYLFSLLTIYRRSYKGWL